MLPQLTSARLGAGSNTEVAEAVRLARHAINVGKDDPDALSRAGWAIATLAGERALGLSAIERALAINPNSALAWGFRGWIEGFSNRPALAIEALQRAIRLSPLDPLRWTFWAALALAHLIAGRYEATIAWADRALHENPAADHALGFKAAACSRLGRIEEGCECIKRFCELRPGWTVAEVQAALRAAMSPEVLSIYLDGLRKAGLPEE